MPVSKCGRGNFMKIKTLNTDLEPEKHPYRLYVYLAELQVLTLEASNDIEKTHSYNITQNQLCFH